jgi:hypothetical protein
MAGPLEELVKRIHRRAEQFKEEHGLDEVAVSVELADGALHRLARISAEPGYGFLSLCPHCSDPEAEPYELIVPLGAIREIRITPLEPPARVGFALADAS